MSGAALPCGFLSTPQPCLPSRWLTSYRNAARASLEGLTELELSGSTFGLPCDLRFASGKASCDLRVLDITGCYRCRPLHEVVRGFDRLEVLRASRVLSGSNSSLKSLESVLRAVPRLQHLEIGLEGAGRMPEERPVLSKCGPALIYLDMSGWRLSEEEIAIIRAAFPKLQKLVTD